MKKAKTFLNNEAILTILAGALLSLLILFGHQAWIRNLCVDACAPAPAHWDSGVCGCDP